MGLRIWGLTLFLLSAGLACNARELVTHDLSSQKADVSVLSNSEEVGRNDQVCTLCEQFATEALDYIAENKTQEQIIKALHKSCSKIPSFKVQCVTLVDYYAPLFFLEVSSMQPGDFCRKVNLCERIVSISKEISKDSCAVCHHAVAEALLKLKDPDTQLEIIELLLKGCNAVEGYQKKCKRLVFEYGPVILINAEQFLETNDLCTILHACPPTKQAFSVEAGKSSMVSDS